MTRPAHDPRAWIGKVLTMTVDRPLGSRHPRHPDIIYPVNYGFIPGTRAADGHPVDAYLLGVDRPCERAEATCIAILHRIDDVEDKLVLCADGMKPSDDDIRATTQFQERFFQTTLIRG